MALPAHPASTAEAPTIALLRIGIAGDSELAVLRDRARGPVAMRLALRSDGAATCHCGEPHATVFVGVRPEDRALPARTRAALRALHPGEGLAARSASAILRRTTLALAGSQGLRIAAEADLGRGEGEVAVVGLGALGRAVADHPAPHTLRLATAALLDDPEDIVPQNWWREPASDYVRALVEALGGHLARDRARAP